MSKSTALNPSHKTPVLSAYGTTEPSRMTSGGSAFAVICHLGLSGALPAFSRSA